jgi:hypothetical protein
MPKDPLREANASLHALRASATWREREKEGRKRERDKGEEEREREGDRKTKKTWRQRVSKTERLMYLNLVGCCELRGALRVG